MSTAARRRLIRLLTVAGVLASAGAAVAATSGSSGSPQAFTVAGGEDRVALTVAAAPAPYHAPARAALPASGSANRALAAATAKPPPVVDGVRRSNVGAAHSPRLTHALSGGPAKTAGGLPASAGARGIDVASYQHPQGAVINWAQVARAGYKFAFVKASEGSYYGNPYYATDLAQAKAAGLNATGYHFAVPNVSGGARQADYAVKHAADGRTMPLALDIEYNPYGAECYGLTAARMVAWISAFTSEVRRLTGQRPIIYSTADWWRTCTGNSAAFGSDPLWVAAYGSSAPPMPAGWRNWTFWQYTSNGRVPGISGNVDLSYFRRAMVTGRAAAPRAPSPGSRPGPELSSPTPTLASPTITPASPTPTPASPTPTPASPTPTAGSPTPTAGSPTPTPASPTPTSASPTPAPSPGTPGPAPGSASPASPTPLPSGPAQ